jgi:hypothetical protein
MRQHWLDRAERLRQRGARQGNLVGCRGLHRLGQGRVAEALACSRRRSAFKRSWWRPIHWRSRRALFTRKRWRVSAYRRRPAYRPRPPPNSVRRDEDRPRRNPPGRARSPCCGRCARSVRAGELPVIVDYSLPTGFIVDALARDLLAVRGGRGRRQARSTWPTRRARPAVSHRAGAPCASSATRGT